MIGFRKSILRVFWWMWWETLDLSAIYASYEAKDGRGQAAYAPEMMVRVLLYGYCVGVYSSRKIETRTYEDVAFRYLSADEHPDHDTIAEFRKRHLEALAGLFTQALLVVREGGPGQAGTRGHRRDQDQGQRQQAQGDELCADGRDRAAAEAGDRSAAEAGRVTDAAEDAQYGKGKRGDELPEELRGGKAG